MRLVELFQSRSRNDSGNRSGGIHGGKRIGRGEGMEGMSIQDQVDNLTVGAGALGLDSRCTGRHDLIFDGEPQAVEGWWRCPVCKAEA